VQISVEGSGIWTTSQASSTNTFFEFTGLLACTSYEVQVRTDCGGTLTDWSPSIILHTLGCGPARTTPTVPRSAPMPARKWIESVNLNTLNNVTGSDDGYGD
jgi:chitodextrinase